MEIQMPFGEIFAQYWEYWVIYKWEQHKFKFKSSITQQMAIKKLVELANGREEIAIAIIEQSISNGWKGFFALKINTNATTKTSGSNSDYANRLAQRITG